MDDCVEGAQSPYRAVAEVLVKLRHEFSGPAGEPHDLKGRSSAYRSAVRDAYAMVGAGVSGALSKRFTAGTAYWVRKILLEMYGAPTLREMGVLGVGADNRRTHRYQPEGNLEVIVGALNDLASDPDVIPTEEVLRAATRAVGLLKRRLQEATSGNTDSAWADPRQERGYSYEKSA